MKGKAGEKGWREEMEEQEESMGQAGEKGVAGTHWDRVWIQNPSSLKDKCWHDIFGGQEDWFSGGIYLLLFVQSSPINDDGVILTHQLQSRSSTLFSNQKNYFHKCACEDVTLLYIVNVLTSMAGH